MLTTLHIGITDKYSYSYKKCKHANEFGINLHEITLESVEECSVRAYGMNELVTISLGRCGYDLKEVYDRITPIDKQHSIKPNGDYIQIYNPTGEMIKTYELNKILNAIQIVDSKTSLPMFRIAKTTIEQILKEYGNEVVCAIEEY